MTVDRKPVGRDLRGAENATAQKTSQVCHLSALSTDSSSTLARPAEFARAYGGREALSDACEQTKSVGRYALRPAFSPVASAPDLDADV
jgi:hypothetical protein